MTSAALLVGGVLVVLLVWLMLANATRLFTVRMEQGHCRLLRGRLPHALLREIEDVAFRARLDGVTLSCHVSDRRAELRFNGPVPDHVVQQLRNVVGRFPLQQIRTGSRRA